MLDVQQLTDWGFTDWEVTDWELKESESEDSELAHQELFSPDYLTTTGLLHSKSEASVVIVTHNSHRHLEACLNSVCCTVGLDCEVVVVDNASTDGSAEIVSEFYPWVNLVRNQKNVGFAAAT